MARTYQKKNGESRFPSVPSHDGTKSAAGAPVKRSRGRPQGTNFFDLNPDFAEIVDVLASSDSLKAPQILEFMAQRFSDLPSLRVMQLYLKDRRATPASVAPSPRRGALVAIAARVESIIQTAHALQLDVDQLGADIALLFGDARR